MYCFSQTGSINVQNEVWSEEGRQETFVDELKDDLLKTFSVDVQVWDEYKSKAMELRVRRVKHISAANLSGGGGVGVLNRSIRKQR